MLLRESEPLHQVRAQSRHPCCLCWVLHGNHCHHGPSAQPLPSLPHGTHSMQIQEQRHSTRGAHSFAVGLKRSRGGGFVEEVMRRTSSWEVRNAGFSTNQLNIITSITGAKKSLLLLSALTGHPQQKHTFLCLPVFLGLQPLLACLLGKHLHPGLTIPRYSHVSFPRRPEPCPVYIHTTFTLSYLNKYI